MENPCLTFVTPALIAGDKSLASIIAHEIAHSWTGNLVTNRDWRNFWINEGPTVFLERKIIEIVYGEDAALLTASVGYKDLLTDISDFEHKGQLQYTTLVPDLQKVINYS
jgi:leukotriene-A4 hydrolase